MKTEIRICKNCGTEFSGNYCNQCGEKVYTDHDKTVQHFIHEAIHFITHFDGKFISSLRLIFFKPGLLAFDYCTGIRKKYFSPLSIFLLGVVIYLLMPSFSGLNVPFHQHKKESYYPIIKPLIEKKLENKKITSGQFAEKYDRTSPKFAKILLLILIPLNGLVIGLLFFRHKKHFFDHLVLSAELNTFFLYFGFLLIPLIYIITGQIAKRVFAFTLPYNDFFMMILHFIALGLVSAFAFRRFYTEKWWLTIFKVILFLLLHAFIFIFIYRLVLALTVLLFI